MKSLSERLNCRIEQQSTLSWNNEKLLAVPRSVAYSSDDDPEVDALVALARRLQREKGASW